LKRAPALVRKHPGPIALCAARRYIPSSIAMAASRRGSENDMRAEVERLVEEIKQSVGLLRRHL
jgi:hypothetical protein